MLSKLSIKNVALIERADIEFSAGLNVLSGETGAGKSVILDALNFVLGAKADKTMIRHGETECMVKAEFFVSETGKAVETLREMDVETDGEIIISRKLTDSGKNTVKINGNTVTATMLRKVTDYLVDVHGQSEHFYLLKESNQLKMLDGVIGAPVQEKKSALRDLLGERKEIDERIRMLGGDEEERNRRLDLLRYQIDEIERVDLKEGEEEDLISRRNKMNNLEKIIDALKDACAALNGEGGALDGLIAAKRAVSAISRIDESYALILDRLENVASEADDLAETLADMGDELYFDENEAEEVEQRIDLIRSVKKKYGANKAEIDGYLQKIQAEYDLLSDCAGQYEILTRKREKCNAKIYQVCLDISKLRQTEGKAFCERVVNELQTLNIPHAQVAIDFSPYGQTDVERATSNGLDEISFAFSANKGEPLKPLGKIISGGEMSRFMLAIKTQLSAINEICTYVFDEIDAGISGKTAKVVGEKLAKIAKNTQILAVSHLAQIASMSDCSFLIEKRETDEKTLTYVSALDETGKEREIVRLLGGEMRDEFATKHAQELLKQAKEYKNTIS
jgi:DNA repair protein RecN (Recombination protein N)